MNTGFAPKVTNRFVLTLGLCAILFFLLPATALFDPWSLLGGILPIIACGICFGIYVRKVGLDLFGICAIGYWLLLMIDGYLMHANLFSCVRYNLPFTSGLLLARAVFPSHRDELLWSIVIVIGGYTALNSADILCSLFGHSFFRQGDALGMLGNRNGFSRYYLPAIVSSALLDYFHGKKLSVLTASFFALAVFQAVIMPSATSGVALVFFMVSFFVIHAKGARRFFNPATFGALYFIAFFAIVILRSQGLFAPIVEGFFHKRLDFSGRTYIWDTVIDRLGTDPLHALIGFYGDTRRLSPIEPSLNTTHNAVLEVLYWGGLLGLLLILTVFILAFWVLFRKRKSYPAALLSIFMGAFLIIGLFEHITCTQVWLFLGIAYSLKDCDDGIIDGGTESS